MGYANHEPSAPLNRETNSTRRQSHRDFEHLFHQFYPGLCRYAQTLLQTEDAAQDVVNEVFVKYWKNQEEIKIRSSIHAYLVTATRNMAIDRLRSIHRHRFTSHELEGDYTTDYAQPYDILVETETHCLIEAAIEALPPQGRLIFRMSRDNGMSYNEIAQALGLSIKTIESHMGRSLKCLRKRLQHTLSID